ncbi:MAG: hydroxymethylbilane synthase [Pseudomonadota bacterium]
MKLRIATRQSPLALWQANHVKELLLRAHADLKVELLSLTTRGDQWQEQSLAKLGGKGLFVKELEEALIDGRADLAVHSMKDVPALLPDGLRLSAFLAAEDPRDAFVCARHSRLEQLPKHAVIGSTSLRRASQLLSLRPDLKVRDLRGNVGTRLKKLDDHEFDAILLACAGLKRLGLQERIAEALDPQKFVPAVGQGIIGVECRDDDKSTRKFLRALNDDASATRLSAERALNQGLGGNCNVPVAGHAVLKAGRISLTGLVASPDGQNLVRATIEGAVADAEAIGRSLAEQLLTMGAKKILRELKA